MECRTFALAPQLLMYLLKALQLNAAAFTFAVASHLHLLQLPPELRLVRFGAAVIPDKLTWKNASTLDFWSPT